MTFEESQSYLLSLGNEVSAMKLGLENIRTLLTTLHDPQNNYLKVQVAGTNGKGSVCAFLDSICNTAGISVGTFTSPHLVSITERIRINGLDISEDDFGRHGTTVRDKAENLLAEGKLQYLPTFFEQVTAIALVAFADANVDIAILETGLGGRLDATTAANAEIAAITRIDLDHQEYLGDTIKLIAAEKAAIIGQNSTAVIGRQRAEAMSVINERCREVNVVPKFEFQASLWDADVSNSSTEGRVRSGDLLNDDRNLGLKGQHQIGNARIAVMVAEVLRFDRGLKITAEDVIVGLEAATHPGRLEYSGKYLFDGAHNVAGASALREFLDEFESRPITLVFGMMRDKDVSEIAEILFSRARNLILTTPENSRAMSAGELSALVPMDFDLRNVFRIESVAAALKRADELTVNEGIILVTGSLYLVGEVKKILKAECGI